MMTWAAYYFCSSATNICCMYLVGQFEKRQAGYLLTFSIINEELDSLLFSVLAPPLCVVCI